MEKIEQFLLKAVKIYLGGVSIAIGLLGLYGLCRPEVFLENADKFIWAGKAIGYYTLGVIIAVGLAYFFVYRNERRNRGNNQNSDII